MGSRNPATQQKTSSIITAAGGHAMKLAEALHVVISLLQDELVVHANGFISRESFNLSDRPGNFYMIGSMGLASSIGLGVAVNRP